MVMSLVMNKQDYKATLNLPKTDFPMKANLAQREPKTLAFWESLNLYNKIQDKTKDKPVFILNDGPPYANGAIHIGHALNKTLKDIVVKSKLLSGYHVPFIPGWDCHGLPIEHQVEKKVGKPGDKVDAKAFRQYCREYAQKQVEQQREAFIRLGGLADWANPYITMDAHFEANVVRSLATIIERGHLHKGEKPVHWCIDCGSALAEAEVEYRDKVSPSIDVRFAAAKADDFVFKFVDKTGTQGQGPVNIVIWTTTPWTLPANQAVALAADLDYVLLQRTGINGPERLVMAEALTESVMKRAEIEHYQVLGHAKGRELEGLMLQHPFYEREVPIVLGDHVTTEAGTGCVHTAPAHGYDDYLMGIKYDLPIDNPVGANGCFVAGTEYFEGEHVFKANTIVVEVLDKANKLLAQEKLEHSYPHCWRHKTPLIFRATPQWFISMEKSGLREAALEEIKKVEWFPDWGEARINLMIDGRPDWCISRQRSWGTPMALVVHKETGELHPEIPRLMREVADRFETHGGLEAWYDLELSELLGDEASDYVKVTDTLDVWFDSGVVHACVLDDRKELSYPADLYLEGSDQHRGWFQTSLLTAVAMKGQAPFKQVLTHGYTVDGEGRKMSKSLGNVMSPDKLTKTLGADIIRLWVSAVDYQKEINVSEEILKRSSDAYRRIRNTARFLLANLAGFDPVKDKVAPEHMIKLDRWIVDKARLLQEDIISAYERYNFHLIYQKIHNFCIVDLGGFYLDVIKDRQYTCKTDGIPRRSAQTALYYLSECLVRWLAPILSFTAEEIWQNMPGERESSVFLSEWVNDLPECSQEMPLGQAFWSNIIQVRDAVNKALEEARNNEAIGSSLEAEVIVYCNDEDYKTLSVLEDELRFVLITSEAKLKPLAEKTSTAVETGVESLWVEVKAISAPKCERCWHRREEVNSIADYPGICGRCVTNISGDGEARIYA